MDTPARDLTAALRPAFPRFGTGGRRLARSLFALLARGFPVSLPVAANAAGLTAGAARDLLEAWWGIRFDSDGRIIGAWGLDLFPTRHQLRVAERDLFAWCAWDALSLPALISEEAEVTSLCPVTGDDIRLRVAPEGILDGEPEDARLALGVPAADLADDRTRKAFCREARFLADAGAGAEWQRSHPGVRLLSLEDGHRLGRRIWRHLLDEG